LSIISEFLYNIPISYGTTETKKKMTIISVLHIITQCHSSEESKRQAHPNNINNESPIFKQLSHTVTSMIPIHNTQGHTNTQTHNLKFRSNFTDVTEVHHT
jgi:hypothetical protein